MNTKQATISSVVVLAVLGLAFFGLPIWNVWSEGLSGEAELARAEQNKQIRIESAKALKEAATHEAEADRIRAQGVADANKIIADGLGGPEGYLRWRYITMLEETGGQGRETIYIPTEAGLPVLEAQRFAKK
jgi:regulator of protease activity HflC (stomatin/prohibitin superfamily)